MMEASINVVRTLLVIILLSSLMELLLPDGGTRPLVKWAMGLFVLAAVLNPIMRIASGNPDFALQFWDYQQNAKWQAEVEANAQQLEESVRQEAYDQMSRQMQGQINALVGMMSEVQKVDTTLNWQQDGQIGQVALKVTSGQGEQGEIAVTTGISYNAADLAKEETRMKEKIASLLENLYGLNPDQIVIEFVSE